MIYAAAVFHDARHATLSASALPMMRCADVCRQLPLLLMMPH